MEPGISVIICCYNSAARLPETLKHIANQQVLPGIKWEVIVVDNSSTDGTADIAVTEWKKHGISDKIFKVEAQPAPGLNNARKKGIDIAQYEYLLFCDDDNWLNPAYLSIAFGIINEDPSIGVLGGLGIIEAEQPAVLSEDLLKQTTVSGSQHWAPSDHWVYGAGSVYRKSMLTDLFNKGWQPITLDRVGSRFLSGGDVELCFMIYLSGKKIIADDRLVFHHFVPLKRQSEDFILKMAFWDSYSYFLLYSYIVFINKEESSFNNFCRTLIIKRIKVCLRQIFNLFNQKVTTLKGPTFEQKKEIQRSYGMIRSFLKNTKKVTRHNIHLKKLLNNES